MHSGQVFQDKYRIEREIGRGSFGIVYLAQEIETYAWRAIKVLLPWTRSIASLKHRLRREAKLTRLLQSPHAVRIHDAGETSDGDFYVVMEYLRGQELNETLRQDGKLTYERAMHITRQVLDALHEAHGLGVIHRDMKPHNIFLCNTPEARDQVKVLDFGIAKVSGTEDGKGLAETTRLTDPGGVLGTPEYMSPEQCRGDALSPASDFYSLAIVGYEMLTGRVPFSDANAVRVMMMHNANPLPPLNEKLRHTPLGEAITKALAKDPRERFQTATEFLAALTTKPPTTAAGSSAKGAASKTVTVATLDTQQLKVVGKLADSTSVQTDRPGKTAGWSRYAFVLLVVALLVLIAVSRYF